MQNPVKLLTYNTKTGLNLLFKVTLPIAILNLPARGGQVSASRFHIIISDFLCCHSGLDPESLVESSSNIEEILKRVQDDKLRVQDDKFFIAKKILKFIRLGRASSG